MPHKGWTHDSVTDLGAEDAVERHTCEMCAKEGIRYVHHLTHPDGHSADVGCECAVKLCVDYEAAPRAEKQIKDRARQRASFTSTRGWKLRANGNHVRNKKGWSLTVFRDKNNPGRWKWVAHKDYTPRSATEWSPTSYASAEDAKRALFDEYATDLYG